MAVRGDKCSLTIPIVQAHSHTLRHVVSYAIPESEHAIKTERRPPSEGKTKNVAQQSQHWQKEQFEQNEVRLPYEQNGIRVHHPRLTKSDVNHMSCSCPFLSQAVQTSEDLELRVWDARTRSVAQSVVESSNFPLCCDVSEGTMLIVFVHCVFFKLTGQHRFNTAKDTYVPRTIIIAIGWWYPTQRSPHCRSFFAGSTERRAHFFFCFAGFKGWTSLMLRRLVY